MNDFYPVITKDGSISLYNKTIEDIYHSSIGAYTEAVEKFVQPSGILKLENTDRKIRILDICFGLGYNSKAAISLYLKKNKNCNIEVDLIELDPYVLALSCLIKFDNINNYVQDIFSRELLKNEKIKEITREFKSDVQYLPFFASKKLNFNKKQPIKGYKHVKMAAKSLSGHNIYYRNISSRNILFKKKPLNQSKIIVNSHIGDAREIIQTLKGPYDFIFHDGFTPAKQPSLWSVEFFKILHSLLAETGNITTYSNSAAVRGCLKEAEFFVGAGAKINNKTFGTVAYKKEKQIITSLSEKENGLILTKAGIPYRDKFLNKTCEQILNDRKKEVESSNRISSSRFLKSLSN